MQEYVPGSDIEVGDEIRHMGDGGVWSKVIKLLTNGVELDGGILYFTEYKNITDHRKGGIDKALTLAEPHNQKMNLEDKLIRTEWGSELYEERKALLDEVNRKLDASSLPEVDPSTFEIGDEITCLNGEWFAIDRLFSSSVEVHDVVTVEHTAIKGHRKQQTKPDEPEPIITIPEDYKCSIVYDIDDKSSPGMHFANADNDPVNHPSHYTSHPSGVECIDITKHMGFCLGNAMKYIWRADLKNDAIEDLKKAVFYLNKEIETREAE